MSLNKAAIAVLGLVSLVSASGYAGSGGDSEERSIYRLDCRFHQEEKHKLAGVRFCYASAIYRLDEGDFENVFLAVGCDNRTIFNDHARVHKEMTLDRIQPHKAATPAVEVFPHGQLVTEGTYTSVLDIAEGRFQGLCYVHPVRYDQPRK